MNSYGLFLLYVKTYAQDSSQLCFWGFVVLLMVFFLIRIPYLLVLPDILSSGGLRVIPLGEFDAYSMCYGIRDEFWEMTFKMDVLLGVSGFMVNV